MGEKFLSFYFKIYFWGINFGRKAVRVPVLLPNFMLPLEIMGRTKVRSN